MIGDIVKRLRRWSHDAAAAPASDLMDEAANMIESLRAEVRSLRWEVAAMREERKVYINDLERPQP